MNILSNQFGRSFFTIFLLGLNNVSMSSIKVRAENTVPKIVYRIGPGERLAVNGADGSGIGFLSGWMSLTMAIRVSLIHATSKLMVSFNLQSGKKPCE